MGSTCRYIMYERKRVQNTYKNTYKIYDQLNVFVCVYVCVHVYVFKAQCASKQLKNPNVNLRFIVFFTNNKPNVNRQFTIFISILFSLLSIYTSKLFFTNHGLNCAIQF